MLYAFWYTISLIQKISFISIFALELFLYLFTALRNPGIYTRSVPTFNRGTIYCKKCLTNKEDNVYHCYDCGVCIKGHDHHCVWTGKCIGSNNYVPFIFFVICTPVYFIVVFLITGSAISHHKLL